VLLVGADAMQTLTAAHGSADTVLPLEAIAVNMDREVV